MTVSLEAIGINYGTLNIELLTDPANLGYSGLLTIGDATDVAGLLNNIGSGAAYSVYRNDIAPREVINVIQPGDFTSLTQIQLSKLQLLFQGAPIDATLSGVRTNFTNIFSGSATLNSGYLGSVAARQGSRAEVILGYGLSVSPTDVTQAMHLSGGVFSGKI